MTLGRQLFFSGLIVLLGLFGGMVKFWVENTQEFLNYQMDVHADNASDAIGISISKSLEHNQIEDAKRVVDAYYDSGYYQLIYVETQNGAPLYQRRREVYMESVPTWFTHLLKLETRQKEKVITSGWMQLGKVEVKGDPSLAYKQVYDTFRDALGWFLIVTVLAGLIGMVLLYIILSPLRAITKQASAICQQEFYELKHLPWTVDLRQVVQAMNNMSNRLKGLFEANAKTAETLREQAYQDPVTNLSNRRYFDLQFSFYLTDYQERTAGALLLIELKDFKKYNEKWGYAAGDHLLRQTGQLLESFCKPIERAVFSHLGGANFGVLLPHKTQDYGEELAEKICHGFDDFVAKGIVEEKNVGSIGVAGFSLEQTQKQILSQADMALRKAQSEGANKCYAFEVLKEEEVHTETDWKKIFETAIEKQQIILHGQEYKLFDVKQKQIEIFIRLKTNTGKVIPAGVFMPMAERLGQMKLLDQVVLAKVMNLIQRQDNLDTCYAVNISPLSLDEDFIQWALNKIKPLGKKARCLMIEVPEYGVTGRLELMKTFFAKLAKLGCQTGIDHYGKGFSAFAYLHALRITRLKIDGSFIREIQDNEQNQFFIRSLIHIARSLDIKTIAESIETQAELDTVKALNVDGVQGYFIEEPKELSR